MMNIDPSPFWDPFKPELPHCICVRILRIVDSKQGKFFENVSQSWKYSENKVAHIFWSGSRVESRVREETWGEITRSKPGDNFINVLRAPFSYESAQCSFFLVTCN